MDPSSTGWAFPPLMVKTVAAPDACRRWDSDRRRPELPLEAAVTHEPGTPAALANDCDVAATVFGSYAMDVLTSSGQAPVPSHTPQPSMVLPAGQQTLAASRVPVQQVPMISTTLAPPPHTPHASTVPDSQQPPDRSSAAVVLLQQLPVALTTPDVQQAPELSVTAVGQFAGL